MPLGNATLKATNIRPEGVLLHVAETEGVPVDGVNLIGIPFVDAGISPTVFDAAYLDVRVRPLIPGSSVSFASEGVHPTPIEPGSALSADQKSIAIDFVQSGGDSVVVQVILRKSEIQ